ncbi:MAG: NAD(P)/FAD-dependent oxidoreductase [Promethearchaeota archaeon]
MQTDVVIIGAGSAGMFAALELAEKSNLKILLVDMGRDVSERKCPSTTNRVCEKCNPCSHMSGIGGAGTLSSGLLNLRPDIGGDLERLTNSSETAWDLVRYVDSVFLKYGAPRNVYTADDEKVNKLARKSAAAGIRFVPIPQRHMGTDNTPHVITNFKDALIDKGVSITIKNKVSQIEPEKVKLEDGNEISCKYILAAPGRVGAAWLAEQARKLNIPIKHGPIDIGVRVEVPAIVMDPVVEVNYDPKFHIYSKTYDDFVRTFCTNARGFVVQEVYDSTIGVNGHAMLTKKSENTNFAFLVRVNLTEPIEDTTAYGQSIAAITTTLGGGKPLLQRLGDLKQWRRSTWGRINRSNVKPTLLNVTPGDIAMAFPHRIVTDILEGLDKLDNVVPGVASSSTLLYAPEIKFYANLIHVDQKLETSIPNLFVAGDGAGLSGGIVTAAATGIIAARGILNKEGIEVTKAS